MKSRPVGADLCVCPCNEGGKGKEGEHIGLPLQKNLPEGWVWVAWNAILAPDKHSFKKGPFGSSLRKAIFVESGYKVYE